VPLVDPFYEATELSDGTAWAVGAAGEVIRKGPADPEWTRAKIGQDVLTWLRGLDFSDDKNGWIVGYKGEILRSNDKGRTWIRQESNTREPLYGLFMDKKFGWAVGAKGVILRYKK